MIIKLLKKRRPKIFCIGAGKTGTTSIEKALVDFGYSMGDQVKGELLLNDYASRNFQPIIDFCKTADAFQDAPFCFKHTFIPLDLAYPDSKFILTIRDTEEQWYDSLVTFHSKLLIDSERIPTVNDLKNAKYRYKGFMWDVRRKVYGFNEMDDPYDKSIFIDYYLSHNKMVIDYFKNKNNLLVINLSDEDSYLKFCKFLNKIPLYDNFPWENKTSEIK